MFRTESVHLQDSFSLHQLYGSLPIKIDKIDKMSSTMLSMWSLYLLLRAHYLFVDGVHHENES
jgi:hypothetical protein